MLFFSGNSVLAFSGLSCLMGTLYLSGELLKLSQQTLVGETERLHLIGVRLWEVGYLGCLAGVACLGDWRGSCLCSESIPSVTETERSALFVKELSFP